MATETQKLSDNKPQEESPRKTLDPSDPPTMPSPMAPLEEPLLNNTSTRPDPLQPPQSPTSETPGTDGARKEGDESKASDSPTVGSPVGSSAANNTALVSDTQKKIRRAERFGMTVQLSEEEKRNSRAERFGTASTLPGSDALKKSEDQKRKARAERFGLPVQSVATDEETKKKARLAKFAPESKTDPLEEDKKKARAIRFSKPPSSSLSPVNGKGDIEPKVAIAGKASGSA